MKKHYILRKILVVPPVSFVDNQDLIDLIEKSNKKNPGLLVMLDEELNLIGAGSDKNFLKRQQRSMQRARG